MAGLGFGVGFFFGSSSPPPAPPSLGLQKMFLQVYGPMSCAGCLLPSATSTHLVYAFTIPIFLLTSPLQPQPGPPSQGTHLFIYSHVLEHFMNNCTGGAFIDFQNR